MFLQRDSEQRLTPVWWKRSREFRRTGIRKFPLAWQALFFQYCCTTAFSLIFQTDEMMPSLSILLALFLWSSIGVVVRTAGVSDIPIIFYSSLVAALLQSILISARGCSRYMPDKRLLKFLLLLGCVGLLNPFS